MSNRLKELRFRVSDEELALIKENAKQLRMQINTFVKYIGTECITTAKQHSKKMASQNANVRRQIADQKGDMQLINALATTERQLREDYDKCVSRLIHGR